jgi:hypothetical protein
MSAMIGHSPSAAAFHIASTPDYLPLRQLRDLQLARLQGIVRRVSSICQPVLK